MCATGGRADHFLGNIHTLKIAMDAGLHAEIIDENNRIFLVDKEYEFEKVWENMYLSSHFRSCEGNYP